MSKSDWERTFGYPEMISYSLHLDSLFSYIAWYNGIQEVILRKPLELFHMEHSSGSGCTPGEGEKKLMTRLEKDSIPTLRHRDLIRYVEQIRDKKWADNPMWGLPRYDFSEFQFNNKPV
jgi:hypothetical protein